ncbi:dihydrodipicolinate reductase [Archaeoglobus neptunius]|uniref:dihydrodipicolinate reductase n=1 Tax=Archaeoglobus neptunius TaxID=2798580 RepID=UPI001926E40A|nr:dihydrodipicolinate reductase [Archaeoglobus neptunius]
MDVVIYGFGPIGRLIAECCVKKGYNVVGAVDVDPQLVGKRLKDFGIKSEGIIKTELEFEGDVAFLCTGSYLDEIYLQIKECLEKGFNVISTCETLSFPYYRYPALSEKLDVLAMECGKTILGSGINPGFLLDSLIVTLSATSTEVGRVMAVRSIDAMKRRESFQRKIGIGLSLEDAEKKLRNGEITGHVGYAESVLLIAKSMGFVPDDVKEGQEFVVKNDTVVGMRGFGSAVKGGVEKIRVEFHSYVGAEEYEEIVIEGDNPVKWRSTGTKGDLGTASVIVNLTEFAVGSKPGLITMADIIPFRPKM